MIMAATHNCSPHVMIGLLVEMRTISSQRFFRHTARNTTRGDDSVMVVICRVMRRLHNSASHRPVNRVLQLHHQLVLAIERRPARITGAKWKILSPPALHQADAKHVRGTGLQR